MGDKTELEKSLTTENEYLKREFEVLRKENESMEMRIAEQNEKIKFMEGQIDAYQYCANCRRN